MKNEIIKFKIGKYEKCSIGDSECIFKYEIVRRTEKSVWIKRQMESGIVRRSISVYDNAEAIYPDGKHSFCTILRPEDRVEEEEEKTEINSVIEITEENKKEILEKLTVSECNESIKLLKRTVEKIEKDSPEDFINMKGEYLKTIKYYELAIELLKNRNDVRDQVQEKVKQASIYGKEVCKQGKAGVPFLNTDLMKIISELTAEEQEHRASLKIMTAWSAAWTIENLKD
jgi:hypothetical protein